MPRLTAEAERQVLDLTEHYLQRDRVEAAMRLAEAVRAALAMVEHPATRWRAAPAPYPDLADAGFRWLRRHRYWFAYTIEAEGAVIHSIVYDAAHIPARWR